MIEELSIVETDKVIHTVETDKMKPIVDVESYSKSADEIDKEAMSCGEMQLKQEDQTCVHASIELHLHAVHVVPSEHESDQHWVLEVEVSVVASPARVLDLITYSSTDSDSSEDPSVPEHALSATATSLFLHSSYSFKTSRDFAVSGSLERPPSLDLYEVTVARWRSKVMLRSSSPSSPTYALPPIVNASPAPCRMVPAPPGVPHQPAILVLLCQEIPFGRPYRTQPNKVLRMMTTGKRVHPVPARISANRMRFHSSSSSPPCKRRRISSCVLSSKGSSPDLSTSLSERALHLVTTHSPSPSAEPSRKRCRSPTTLVTLATSTPGALVHESLEVGSEEDIDSDVMADIEADIEVEAATADETRAETEAGFEGDDEAKSSARGMITLKSTKMEEDKKIRRKHKENDFQRFLDKLRLDKRFGGPL
ncbi:hypothetical protein Tco_0681685 [Tanacetum coccineum]|uniref:Uncharacterized protein n=1 Tax=Tanacetum coccineum TaxID=301880 RepID=A0ABQ4XPS2_9ASTR